MTINQNTVHRLLSATKCRCLSQSQKSCPTAIVFPLGCYFAPVGAREWWKHFDSLSQCRCSSAKVTLILDMQYLAELNDYFAELCWDGAYKRPTPAQVESGVQVPEISERQVWNCLQHLKKTATGPDLIPFWVWRDHVEIFTSLICKIWNLSLRFSARPSSWKRAHVPLLSKVDVPKGKTDYRGININPVINLEISIDNYPASGAGSGIMNLCFKNLGIMNLYFGSGITNNETL